MADADGTRARVTGVVLAGGASLRMGQSKAALSLHGEPMLRRVVRRLERALPNVLVIGPAELAELVPGTRVTPDLAPGGGPLGGLRTALHITPTPWAFVVACDMPFVAPALVQALARLAANAEREGCDAVVLRTPRGLEPLHTVYHRSCLATIERQIASTDHSLAALLNRLRVLVLDEAEAARVDPTGRSAFNANTPEEWQRAQQLVDTEDL